MASDPLDLRLRLTGLAVRVAKAKGGRGGAQPRHPAGSSLGGQWMGTGAGKGGSVLSNLMGSVSQLFGGAKALADPNWGMAQAKPPAHTFPSKNSVPHPSKDDQGRTVHIHRPKTPTPPDQWKGADQVVTVTPGAATPPSLNGVTLKAVGSPGDWTKVWGQNPGIEKGLPDLEGHKYKHAAAGVIIREPDGRIWLCSPTNGFGGYRNTFPKGSQEPGLNLQQTAIKEAWEETGLKVRITGVLGDFERTTSVARYYMAERIGGTPAKMGWESQALRLAPPSALKSFLNMPIDRDIASLLFEEHDLRKSRAGNRWLSDDEIRLVAAVLVEPRGLRLPAALSGLYKAKGGGGGPKEGHWTKQPRWPAGTPLGGQWKTYDGDGLPVPPKIGSASNQANQLKADAAYAAVKAGHIDKAVLILKPLELKAMGLGYAGGNYPTPGNSQQKWALQAHQYVTDVIAASKAKGTVEAKAEKLAGPEVLSTYKKIGPKPGGSNPGGVYSDGKGGEWLVKGANYPSDDRAKNEVLVSKLMQAAGVAAPDMKLVDLQGQYGGGLGVAAKMEPLDKWTKTNPVHLANAQADFAVHAWLANYDAVGLPAGDNLAVLKGTTEVFNYDPGGGLLFRAQGLPKTLPGGMLSAEVKEWDSMRNKSIAAPAASVYGSMTADQLKASAGKLQQVTDQQIKDLVAAHGPGGLAKRAVLAQVLIDRKADILAKAGLGGVLAAGTPIKASEALSAAQIKPQAASGGGYDPKVAQNPTQQAIKQAINDAGMGLAVTATGKFVNAGAAASAMVEHFKLHGAMLQTATNNAAHAINESDAAKLTAAINTLKTWSNSLSDGKQVARLFENIAAAKGMTLTGVLPSGKTSATADVPSAVLGAVAYEAKLTNTEPGHNKFYDVKVIQNAGGTWDVVANWGKVGTVGQTMVKSSFTTPDPAVVAAKALMNTKQAKGYQLHLASEHTSVILGQNKPAAPAPVYGNNITPTGKQLLGEVQAMINAQPNSLSHGYAQKLHDLLAGAKTAEDESKAHKLIKDWSPLTNNLPQIKDKLLAATTEVMVTMGAGASVAGALDKASIVRAVQSHAKDAAGHTFADSSSMGFDVKIAAKGIAEGHQPTFDQGMTNLKIIVESNYAISDAKVMAQKAYDKLNELAAANGLLPTGPAVTPTQNSQALPQPPGNLQAAAAKNYAGNMLVAADKGDAAKIDQLLAEATNHPVVGGTWDVDELSTYAKSLKAAMGQTATGSLPTISVHGLSAVPTPTWGGIKGAMGARHKLSFARSQAKQALIGIGKAEGQTIDVAKLQEAYDGAKTVADGFKLGSKGRTNALMSAAWIVENAQKAGLTIEGGKFKVPGQTSGAPASAAFNALATPANAATEQAKVMLDRVGLGTDSIIGQKVVTGVQALESGDDKGLATIIGGLALDGSPSAIALSEKLTAMAEAKGGFPMATGAAATIVVQQADPFENPAYTGFKTTGSAQSDITAIASQTQTADMTLADQIATAVKQLHAGEKDGYDVTVDAIALGGHGESAKALAMLGGLEQSLKAAKPLPAPPATPPFQETTGSAVAYYTGKANDMVKAYQAGDIAALQKLAVKPNGSGPLWPTFKSGTNKGQPKGINGKLMKEFHDTLVKGLVDKQSADVQAKLDTPVAHIPAPGENTGSLPAMPKFASFKIADTNSNAGSHNAKIDTIEKLAAKGDVKGILALNYGTNTYGKKQAALANDALSALGSPFQVDIGQKKHSHHALTGAVTAAAVVKSAAIPEKELPPKLDFMNWNGAGKGLSSSANVNQSNQAVYDQLRQLAMAGDLNGLKSFTFQPINKETGQPQGAPQHLSNHPSSHIKNFQEYLLQAIDERLNPPKPLEIFEAKQAAAHINNVASKFPPKPLGITSKKVPSSQAIGHYIAIAQVKGVDHLVPKKQQNFGPAQDAQAKADYQQWRHDPLAESFRSKVQGTGGHWYHKGWDDPSQTAYGTPGKPGGKTGAQLVEHAKAAHKWARKQPPGTKVYKWESLTPDMKQKLATAQPGLILQNPAPTCCSKSPTNTKGFGPGHRWNIIFTEGAKGLNSYASGSHPSEQEVTMLPNHRFMVISHSKSTAGGFAETTVLLLPPDPALDSDGYKDGYGY